MTCKSNYIIPCLSDFPLKLILNSFASFVLMTWILPNSSPFLSNSHQALTLSVSQFNPFSSSIVHASSPPGHWTSSPLSWNTLPPYLTYPNSKLALSFYRPDTSFSVEASLSILLKTWLNSPGTVSHMPPLHPPPWHFSYFTENFHFLFFNLHYLIDKVSLLWEVRDHLCLVPVESL